MQQAEGKQRTPSGKVKIGGLEEIKRGEKNGRNREAKRRARTVTGPLVWCSQADHSAKEVGKCPRCGARQQHWAAGIRGAKKPSKEGKGGNA